MLPLAICGCSKARRVAGDCRTLQATAAVDDIALDEERGVAYLTYLDRRKNDEGKRPTGTIMLVDLNAKEPRIRAALITDPPDFRPVALNLDVATDGVRRLYAVDDNGARYVFEQSTSGTFALTKNDDQRKLTAPNEVVTRGKRSLVGSSSEPYLQLCETK
jgi:arylesterase / paraoxonase